MTSLKPEDLAVRDELVAVAIRAFRGVGNTACADAITSLSRELEEARKERDETLMLTIDNGVNAVAAMKRRAETAEASLTQARAGDLTEEMVNAGIAALGSDDDRQPAAVILDVWRAMHGAASWSSPS